MNQAKIEPLNHSDLSKEEWKTQVKLRGLLTRITIQARNPKNVDTDVFKSLRAQGD